MTGRYVLVGFFPSKVFKKNECEQIEEHWFKVKKMVNTISLEILGISTKLNQCFDIT
jgi:hypothetical protein